MDTQGVLYARNDVMAFVCHIRSSLLRQSREVASQRMRHARGTIVLGGEARKSNVLEAGEALAETICEADRLETVGR